MRMKEATERTGLSEWTIRYYLREGLISPKEEVRNGRTYYDYQRQDLAALEAIRDLRCARFSLEDIRRMQSDPSTIPALLADCVARLEAEAGELERLRTALSCLDGQSAPDYLSLGRLLRENLEETFRSSYVPELHFGALDEPEPEPSHRRGFSGRTDTQPVDIDAPAIFNTAALGKKRALDDLKSDLRSGSSAVPVQARTRGPRWLDSLVTVLEVLSVVLWTLTVIVGFEPHMILLSLGLTAMAAGLIILQKKFPWRDRQAKKD